ncbi:MAG: nitronate monooxygenase [Anaeromyxobacter sp.]|nr:nitronate monooxygenase [Anaeromyxobacter sp.]MBL0276483.1 nitronate monooxygenase [Anaeromyxobacter sp.]
MGIGVSNWRLANAVARAGQLGVVSGVAIDAVLARRLQDGDPGGHMRRAMERFPIPKVAAEALARHFRPGGREPGKPYALLPMYQQEVSRARDQFSVLSAFVEVWLAREGHAGLVGINLLTKIQMGNLAFLYGAVLAGVDYVIMGAGIPREIPGALDALARHEPAQLRLDLMDAAPGQAEYLRLDPAALWEGAAPVPVTRPRFLPIIASNLLATMLIKKATGRIDGFVIEGPTAGGHNAPPRDRGVSTETGEPLYGPRDVVDLELIRKLGLPFWVAGSEGRPDRLRVALAAGAAGIQVGTLFAYCDESGITEPLRRSILEAALRGAVRVRTDARASPTGFPFKRVAWEGDPAVGVDRKRICDLGYLRDAYGRGEKGIGYRCASEPEDQFVAKGGAPEELPGRECLCNSLLATVGLGQLREGGQVEPPLLTSGDEAANLAVFLAGRNHYAAADVVRWLLDGAA